MYNIHNRKRQVDLIKTLNSCETMKTKSIRFVENNKDIQIM